MTFQTEILADLTRRERALDASPARLERRRAARLLEAIARCCRDHARDAPRAPRPGAVAASHPPGPDLEAHWPHEPGAHR